MSADRKTSAERREELEAILWRNVVPTPISGHPEELGRRTARRLTEDILAAADLYARASAEEAIGQATGEWPS